MTFKEQKEIFRKTLDWIQDRIDKKILDSTSGDLIEDICGTLRREITEYFKGKRSESRITSKILKDYYSYLDKNVFARNKGISKYGLKDLEPKFEKELKNRVINSLNLIKNKDEEIKNQLVSRLINWITIDSPEVRGNKTTQNSLLEFMDFAKESGISERHAKFILTDQSHKMREAFDKIVREDNGAIAGIWHNMQDIKVTGNPRGSNKPTKAHGNHWIRENKLYIFKDSWANQQGLVKGDYYEDLEDGGVAVAIGCRCYLESIYDLRDMPLENLTKKGIEYLEEL